MRKLSKVNCRYGAPMGRPSICNVDPALIGKLHLRRVIRDSGGYDSGGAYWGLGGRLWWYYHHAHDCEGLLWAESRDAAKQKIRETFPDVQFYR